MQQKMTSCAAPLVKLRHFPTLGFATPQTPIAISGTGEDTDFKFGQNISRIHPNKKPLKILEKRKRGRFQGLSNFFEYPANRQSTKFKFCTHIHRLNLNKSPLKFREKCSRGRTQGLSKFFRASIYRVHRAVIFANCDSSAFLLIEQESCAIAKTTARCALYIAALKILHSH